MKTTIRWLDSGDRLVEMDVAAEDLRRLEHGLPMLGRTGRPRRYTGEDVVTRLRVEYEDVLARARLRSAARGSSPEAL